MAKLLKDSAGYWQAKEVYKGQQSIIIRAAEPPLLLPTKKLLKVTIATLIRDIKSILKVTITSKTPKSVIRALAKELCNSEYGMHYCEEWQSPHAVRKISNDETFKRLPINKESNDKK